MYWRAIPQPSSRLFVVRRIITGLTSACRLAIAGLGSPRLRFWSNPVPPHRLAWGTDELGLDFGVARAQVAGGDVPELNAQTFRPTVDGRRLLWLDDGAKASEASWAVVAAVRGRSSGLRGFR